MRGVATASDYLNMSDPNAAVVLSLHEVQRTQILTHSEKTDDPTPRLLSRSVAQPVSR
ncbi:hypothetical protein SAMN06295943_3189 [Agreia sp. VKM Ac-1783]|jgi:hypothetical protein|nr:hypothetical protein SAMN06295943_3189 [Agreia sp. VKM Ac-1783]